MARKDWAEQICICKLAIRPGLWFLAAGCERYFPNWKHNETQEVSALVPTRLILQTVAYALIVGQAMVVRDI